MGWILETNTPMNRAMEGMGGKIVKRYRIYEDAGAMNLGTATPAYVVTLAGCLTLPLFPTPSTRPRSVPSRSWPSPDRSSAPRS